jgi:hypothetical protein
MGSMALGNRRSIRLSYGRKVLTANYLCPFLVIAKTARTTALIDDRLFRRHRGPAYVESLSAKQSTEIAKPGKDFAAFSSADGF